MNATKKIITVVTKANYTTIVTVNGVFAYESFLHRSREVKNIKHLIHLLQIDAEVVDGESDAG